MIAVVVLCISSHAENAEYCCMHSLGGSRNSFYIGRMTVRTFHSEFIALVSALKDCFTMF